MSGYFTVILSGIATVAILAILLQRHAAVGQVAGGLVKATGSVSKSFQGG